MRDFAPVGLIGSVQNVLLAYTGSQIDSVRNLIERAKAQPGKLTVASPGIGSSQHLAAELFEQAVGIDLVQVDFIPVPAALTLVSSRQLKAPEMKSQFASIGQDALWSTPEAFSSFLAEETTKWHKVIQAIGLKME